MKITIIGTGYVGLVSGVCFAALGHDVTCIDTNREKIENLKKGISPIYEPGLDVLMQENIVANRLHFSDQLTDHIKGSDALFIAVGTPTANDGVSADLTSVFAVAESIANHLQEHIVIVTKSTVPVLTNAKIEQLIKAKNPKANFSICSNPEFLREGSAIQDFMQPDRIVVGVRTTQAHQTMKKLYEPLTNKSIPLIVTTPESAELIKYAANAFLATKVAFINEVANIAEVTGGDIATIAQGIGLDTRIGQKFLQAGPGYGGSCFPKDTKAFAQIARENNTPSQIIEAVIESNQKRKHEMGKRIFKALDGSLANKKIIILGVTFKANTDDMRDSVALDIIPYLLHKGAQIHAFDPASSHQAENLLPLAMTWYPSLSALQENALTDADAIVVLTDWPEFKSFDFTLAAKKMRQKNIIDLRNFFDPHRVIQAGFNYYPIGHQPLKVKS
jgi:UDPglucose 6-dehydrogenase